MKKFTFLIFTALLFCLVQLQAQNTAFLDDFTSGTNPGYTLPAGGGTISVETAGTGLTGNALLLSTTSNNRTIERGIGSSIALANIGDYIELSADYRFTATLDDNFGVTAGLFSSTSEGGMNYNPSAGSSSGTYFTDTDNNSGRFDTINSGTTAQTFTFRITRTTATEVEMSSSFNGSPRAGSNTQTIGGAIGGTAIGSPLAFDKVSLGWVSGNSGDIYYDNVTVVTNVPLISIPEPSSLALLGLALGGWLLFRRRK